MKETDETLSFPIDSDTKNNFNIYSVYKDKDGKEYFTFQNIENNTIHFYDLKQQKPAFRITPSQEGSNGVGRIFGYYIQNLDSIYVFNFYESGLYLINKNCDLLDKQPFPGLKPSCFMATASQLPVRIEHTLYTLSLIHISEPTRPEPIFFFNDTATTEIYTLEFVGSVRCV